MTRNVDWQFWMIVTLVSIAFFMAFVSVGDEPTVSATEIGAGAAHADMDHHPRRPLP